jgi:hypothetical protein
MSMMTAFTLDARVVIIILNSNCSIRDINKSTLLHLYDRNKTFFTFFKFSTF